MAERVGGSGLGRDPLEHPLSGQPWRLGPPPVDLCEGRLMRCGGDLTFLLRETLICPLPQELCQDLEGIPVTGHEQSLRAFGGPRGTGDSCPLHRIQTGSPACWGAEERVPQTLVCR